MKNGLLYISGFCLLLICGCKKEEQPNTDPFTNGTQFDHVYNATVVVKNDSIILSYNSFDDSTQESRDINIEYFGDTTAVVTFLLSGIGNYNTSTKYYLNNMGLADSSVTNVYSQPQSTYKNYYSYFPNGYLQCISISRDSCTGGLFEYVNGNYSVSNSNYEYYDYASKLDFLSVMRKYDNTITGYNDKNLPKRIRFANFDDSYYYQFDSNGYVTSMIIFDKSAGITTYLCYNFTYQFIQ